MTDPWWHVRPTANMQRHMNKRTIKLKIDRSPEHAKVTVFSAPSESSTFVNNGVLTFTHDELASFKELIGDDGDWATVGPTNVGENTVVLLEEHTAVPPTPLAKPGVTQPPTPKPHGTVH